MNNTNNTNNINNTEYDTTLIFDMGVANRLLSKGNQIIRIRRNYKEPEKPVYVFNKIDKETLDEAFTEVGYK